MQELYLQQTGSEYGSVRVNIKKHYMFLKFIKTISVIVKILNTAHEQDTVRRLEDSEGTVRF